MAKSMFIYPTASTRGRVKEFYIYPTVSTRGRVTKGYFFNASGQRCQFFARGGGTLSWTINYGQGSGKKGYIYFNFGSTVPELPRARDNGAVTETWTDGTKLTIKIGGIGGAMVTRDNVFVSFDTGDFSFGAAGVVTAASATFTPSGSAGNSTGVWSWPTTLPYAISGSNPQSLTLV